MAVKGRQAKLKHPHDTTRARRLLCICLSVLYSQVLWAH